MATDVPWIPYWRAQVWTLATLSHQRPSSTATTRGLVTNAESGQLEPEHVGTDSPVDSNALFKI